MDERLVKAARVGDVYELHNLLEADPEILERVSLAHFADSALHVAALCGKADFVEQIVTRKPSLATDTNQKGMIPLHLASLQGHVETVRELLKAKLEDGVNQCLLKDDEGWNPLHCASQKGKIMVMEELIRECPECLEQVTEKGETVLHLAVKANQFGAVKVLAGNIKRHNLQILLKSQDQKGKSAYQLAAAKRQFQVLETLKEDEKGDDEIREESRINVKGDGNDDSEESEKEESNVCHHQFLDAILIVAALIITLTYQALANPPSTFLKDGNTTINWSCINQRSSSQGFIKHLKECPAALALLFMIFNTLIFFQSIFIVVNTLPGVIRIPVRLLLLFLVLCYSFLLTAFCSNALYFAFPFALLVIFFFFFSRIHGDPEPLIITIFRLYISRIKKWRQRQEEPEGS